MEPPCCQCAVQSFAIHIHCSTPVQVRVQVQPSDPIQVRARSGIGRGTWLPPSSLSLVDTRRKEGRLPSTLLPSPPPRSRVYSCPNPTCHVWSPSLLSSSSSTRTNPSTSRCCAKDN